MEWWMPLATAAAEGAGKGLASPGGPSRADSGGGSNVFANDWTVSTGSSKASSSSSAALQTALLAVAIGAAGWMIWKLAKKS